MDRIDIIQHLLKISISIQPVVRNIDCYLFGSILTNKRLKNDIDILVVYQHAIDVIIVRESLREIELMYPIQLLFLNTKEEREFNFISQQNALKIFSINDNQ